MRGTVVALRAGTGPAVLPPAAGTRATVPAGLLGSGQVRPATAVRTGEAVLPVHAALRGLLPDGGLRRGSTVAVATATGGLSLLYALLAAASADGTWCAAVGVPELGAAAAAEYGVVPERFALVPEPGPDWLTVTAALLDGFGLVLVRPPGRAGGAAVTPTEVRRLAARARQRGTVLLVHGVWPGADVALRTRRIEWRGLGTGRGRLRSRAVTVDATGRGAAARPRSVRVLLPAGGTGTAAVAPDPARPMSPPYAVPDPSRPMSRPALAPEPSGGAARPAAVGERFARAPGRSLPGRPAGTTGEPPADGVPGDEAVG